MLVLFGGWIVTAASVPVHADDDVPTCDERMPWKSLTGSGANDAGSGTFSAVPSLMVGGTISAGGTTLAGSVAGHVATGIGAFLLASKGTCWALDTDIGGNFLGGFLDALLGAPATIQPVSSYYAGSTEWGDPTPCSAYGATWLATGAPAVHKELCRTMSLPSTSPESVRWYINDATRTRGGNVMPAASIDARYCSPNVSRGSITNGSYCPTVDSSGQASVYSSTSANVIYLRQPNGASSACALNDTSTSTAVCYGAMPSGSAPGSVSMFYFECTVDVGDACGIPPGYMVYAAGVTTANPVQAVAPLWPEVNERGWARRWIVDYRCRSASGSTQTWRRVETGPFYDATPTQRVPVPVCPNAGELLTSYRIALVPTNLTCAAATGSGCDAQWLVQTWEAPSTWTNTATAPDWTLCLTRDTTCGTPAVDGVVCEWGTFNVSADWCDEDQLTGATQATSVVQPGTVPGVVPTVGEILDTSNPVTEDPDPVDPPGPPSVNVPIDPGNDEKCSDPSETACFGGAIDLDSSGECFPDGWGWFNPVQWVLRPIKCAVVWAFLPEDEDLEEFVDSIKSSVEGTFPLSLFPTLAGLLETFGDAAATSATTCHLLDMEVAGTAPGCFTIPPILNPEQRELLELGLVLSLILAIAWSSIRLVAPTA